jgi:PAS domain S-box-containing protein
MNNVEFQLQGVGDPRLAVHATSALPAWLWSTDGTRILWANPVGARLFGAANAATLAKKTFGPADSQRRQVAQLANRLPWTGAIRLERLRGFGAALGALVTCGCARLDFADGSHGILVAAAESIGRQMPLVERLQRLVEDIDTPIAAFTRDGRFVGASNAARSMPGFRDLAEADLDSVRDEALKQGRAEIATGTGRLVLQRVGFGADIGLVALMVPEPTPQPVAPGADRPTPDYEQPALSGEAPAEFALFDEFVESPAEAVQQAVQESSQASCQELSQESSQEPPRESSKELSQELPRESLQESPQESPQEPLEAAPPEPDLQTVLQLDMPHGEAPPTEPSIETSTSETSASESELHPHEPSPYVEAVADEPSPEPLTLPAWLEQESSPRLLPLRFLWQIDAAGRFALRSDEFIHLIGARSAAGFGRPWSEVAHAFALDPDGRVAKAIATHDTWANIALSWPVDNDDRLPVELSGLPMFDRAQNFVGYRGFGVCRDLDALARLEALRRYEFLNPPALRALSADIVRSDHARDAPAQDWPAADLPVEDLLVEDLPVEDLAADLPVEDLPVEDLPVEDLAVEDLAVEDLPVQDLHAQEPPAAELPAASDVTSPGTPESSAPTASGTSHPTDLENLVETPKETLKNVLPFRPLGETKSLTLTPVENSAFNELARQLAARLDTEMGTAAMPATSVAAEAIAEPAALAIPPEPELVSEQPQWLVRPEAPARGESRRDRTLLDLLPVGVLIYRLDRLLYANPAFLARMGYDSLHALEEAGGLDALYVEPGVSTVSSTSDTGTPVTISGTQASAEHTPPSATDAHLYTIAWDDESALALIFAANGTESTAISAALAEPIEASPPSAVGHANAEELGAILDTTAEGIVMFDAGGHINSCNRSAEALFGYDGAELAQRNLTELFAPESQPAVKDYLESIQGADLASLLDHGRDVLGRVREGGLIPLSVTMGRTRPDGPNFFAVFRDLSQSKKSEGELLQARRLTDRAANAKADMLARISHEVRTPLNAIIGFAEVMIGERFGALGNERYIDYMKDIRASGERVIAIINDLLDLSRIETGKIDLAFANQNLNDMVEQCVAVMQPQANRERIIIRTSLAHQLPPVVADARALRQIALNLIGNSIHLANAGGQVIVSTALSDFGEVVLRVRDTGHGLNDNEVAAALEPFRTSAPSDQASDSPGVSLSLTKALVEANRAQFHIKTGAHSGTLIEVVFSHAVARA